MSLIDDFPLAGEYPEAILARLVADINAGIDPSDPLYADTELGSVWDDVTRAQALEIDRLYDRLLTEVPAAALPGLATGLWLDAWADTVGLDRKDAAFASGTVRFSGPDLVTVPAGTQVSTESPTVDADPVTFTVVTGGSISGGHVDLLVVAVTAGSQGNVAANAITILDSVVGSGADAVTVTNPAAITAGDDVETDERLQGRVLKKVRGTQGAGNIDYYVNLALNQPGIGFAVVQPNTPGLGDVRVVVTDINNDPVSSLLLDSLQETLDPLSGPGVGAGLASIGAVVTVATPDPVSVTVAATIIPDAGYSVDGAGGTQALDADIRASVAGYIDSLEVDADVILNKVIAAIVDVEGVADVSGVTINGVAGDAAIAGTEVALLIAVTLA